MSKIKQQKRQQWVQRFWYRKSLLAYCLCPLAWMFQLITWFRYGYLKLRRPYKANIPVIIVGNITVGGTGKTPLVATLGNYLNRQGIKPAIVMHGYRSALPKGHTVRVWPSSPVSLVGDEALLMAKNCQDVPVIVTRKRASAFAFIEKNLPNIDVIICDDGLQHYAIARDIEIAVVDSNRQFGNGFCLPIGPLREGKRRLKRVDFVVYHGKPTENAYLMQSALAPEVTQIDDEHSKYLLEHFVGKKVHAVAGIGYPERFFMMLREKGIEIMAHAFSDHHQFTQEDLTFKEDYPILMTQKDAVKCTQLKLENAFAVDLAVTLDEAFLENVLRRLQDGQKTARHSGVPPLQATSSV